jgi:hypothetical protein
MVQHSESLVGRVFGRLTVLGRDYSPINTKNSKWFCECSCGNKLSVGRPNLKSNHTLSCGCYNIEKVKEYFITHGLTESETYYRWTDMKTRCLNKNSTSYPRYGGNGVIICDRWIHSFENFLEDMGECKKGMTLDRIDNDKGYSKENCRWVPKSAQSRNRKCVKFDMEKARYIRFLVKNNFKQTEIAKFFYTSKSNINCIVKHKTFKEELCLQTV